MKATKRLRSTYLYADGHAVCMYEKQDKDAGLVEFVEIYEQWTKATLSFEGRIIIGRYSEGLQWLCRTQATSISAELPSVDRGSDATRAKGISFGTLRVNTKGGALYFHDMPGTISGPYTYQRDQAETFDAGCARWSGHPVARIHRVKTPELADAVVA